MLKSSIGLGTCVSGKGIVVGRASALCILLTALIAPVAFAQQANEHATVTLEDHHDVLASLRNAAVPPNGYGHRVHFEGELPLRPGPQNLPDGALQPSARPSIFAPTLVYAGRDGLGNGAIAGFTVNSEPPDTVGAIGATQYVQVVNSGLVVFDKTTHNIVYGPVPTNTLWSSFGGGCQTNNDGDAVVVYDRIANRWVVSQFSVSTTPYLECVAVSQTSDATGAWNRYSFSYGSTNFPDYPKMGVWPDGYYTTFNVFAGGSTFAGANLCAYDRAEMLTGAAATQQCFQTNTNFGGVLPADLDGSTQPPANSPNYLLGLKTTTSLALWKFHVDWTTPANSTISPGINSPTSITVASYAQACGGGTCITQPGVTQKLDSLADRMMFRLVYRNFGSYEALVTSHSVTAGTSTGTRWYEIRSPGTVPVIYQQSTFAPDSSYRWMGSIALDQQGNMALGYSMSSKANGVNPSIRYTGRLATDTLNTMQAEASLVAGTGSQSGHSRWGDYSAMSIDPVDDCTFWYTNEYMKTTGDFQWNTWIASFKFPSCGSGSTYTIGGSVTNLTASGLVMAVTADSQTVSVASGAASYVFPTAEPDGTSYTVSVQTQPTGQTCTVANPSGTISGANVTNANVTCKTNQAITFTSVPPGSATVGGATYNVTATGGASGNAVTFTIDATASSVCSISGATVSFIGAGTCVIDANQAGNANYNAAPQAQQSFGVGKASQTISFTSTAPAAATVGGATYNVTATATSGLTVAFTIDATASSVCSISGATVSFTGVGTCVIDADQAGNANYNAAPQAQQSFGVGKASQTISFTSTAPAAATVGGATYNVTATGGASGNAVTFTIDATASSICSISGSTVSFIGAGTCVIDANQAGNANYNAAPQAQQSFGVGKASQTISFTSTAPAAATVGGATYNVTATATSGLTVAFTIDATASSVCSISGATVSFTGVGTCVIDADQAGNANYNAAPQAQQSFGVGKASQTISYTSTAPAAATVGGATYNVTATGGASGNAVTFTIDATASSICSISGSTVSFIGAGTCVIDANQAGNANYNAAPQAQQSFGVGKASQTISFTSTAPAAATVGGATYNVTATGGASGNAVTFTIDATASSVCSISGATVSFIGAGTCVIDANQAGNANYNAAPQAQQSFGVGKASQTISFTSTAPAAATVGGATYNVTATATSGLTVAFTIDATASSVCSISGATVSFTGVGTCVIDADQAGNANYNAAPQAQQSFGVGKASQTISYTSTAPAAATVGGATYNVTATGGASGNAVTFTIDATASSICSISGATVSFIGAGTCVIDANQAGNANYNAAPQAQQSFGVGKASQTISYTSTAPAAATVGGATYNVTATGGASGNAVTFTIDATASSVCSISGATVSFIGAGTCVIDANQAGNANYNAAPQAQQSFGVGKASQTISYTSTAPAAATVGGATYNVTATATSGLTVAFTIDATASSVCSISGATVSFTGVGTCVIDADQAGNANYNAAPQAQQSFGVGKASQTISFTSTAPAAATVGGATYNVTATGGASGNAVTFTIDATASSICSISGSTVSFIGAGTCVIDANQAGNANYNAAPQAQQSFGVGKASQTISFTSTAPAAATVGGATYNVTATGGASGNAVTFTIDATASSVCSISGATVSFIGVGTCVIDANQAGNANYNAAPQAQQSFGVGKASQTISYTSTAPAAATVGGATYNVTATATSGLTVAFTIDATASSVCSISGATVSFTGVGTCVIDANQAGNANYNAAPQKSQSFAVGKADQTIMFSSVPPGSAAVGGATYTATATATSGLTVALTIDASAASVCSMAGSTVSFIGTGTCKINANQPGNGNYNAAPQAQQSFAVSVGAATQLVFTTQPANLSQGTKLGTVVVTEKDSGGNTVPDNGTVDFTITACGGSVDLGSVTMVSGVATLNSSQLFYAVASGLQIGASTGSLSANSAGFDVTANSGLLFSNGFESCRL